MGTTRGSLPPFNPSQGSFWSRLRLLPGWALTLVSFAVPLLIGIRLWSDDRDRELFELPYHPAPWAGAAGVMAAMVAAQCRRRPGTFWRQGLPNLWTLAVTMVAVGLLVLALANQPAPGSVHVAVFATVGSAMVLLFRLLPLQPMERLVQWIGVIALFGIGSIAWVAGTQIADYLVDRQEGVASRVAEMLETRAQVLRGLKPTVARWSESMTPPQIEERLHAVSEALKDVDADLPGGRQLERIVYLGPAARTRVQDVALALADALEELGTTTDGAYRLVREAPPSRQQLEEMTESHRRRLDARRKYVSELTRLLRSKLASADLRRLEAVFQGVSSHSWEERLAAAVKRLDEHARELERAWGTFWLGRGLSPRAKTAPAAEALVGVQLSETPGASQSTDGDGGVTRLGELDKLLNMNYSEAQQIANARVVCVGRQSSPGQRASCSSSGWFRQRQSYSMACALHDVNPGARPLVTLRMEYESSRSAREPDPCTQDPTLPQSVTYHSIWPGLAAVQRPQWVEIDFAVPGGTSPSDYGKRLTEVLEDMTRERGSRDIQPVPRGIGFVYQPPEGPASIRITTTPDDGFVRIRAECAANCR